MDTILLLEHVVSPYAKNDSSERSVTLPQKILGLVFDYREEQQRIAKLLGKTWTEKGFVFVNELCNPIPLSTLSEWMIRFRARNSIMHITPKDLRHLHATILGKAKIPVKNASSRMGHAKTSTTLDIYSHDFQDSDALIAQAIDDLVKL